MLVSMRTATITTRDPGPQPTTVQLAAVPSDNQRQTVVNLPLTIRRAGRGDRAAVARLAALDSARVPSGPLLLAEVNGELRAALSLSDRQAVADPFQPTAAILDLLTAVAAPRPARRTRRGLLWRPVRIRTA
jgi:hypothetical protein